MTRRVYVPTAHHVVSPIAVETCDWHSALARWAIGLILTAFSLVFSGSLVAQTQEINDRYDKLAHELRCLVCQNQSLAESDADLAKDLKKEVRSLITQGKNDEEIKTYLKTRYGDFILYKPPMQANTWVLWLGPFAALGVGAIVGIIFLRKRTSAPPNSPASPRPMSAQDQAELEERLK
jgi:cytochrome c-type biogenesis protein CcmH